MDQWREGFIEPIVDGSTKPYISQHELYKWLDITHAAELIIPRPLQLVTGEHIL